ncbi:MAG: hypothetical protein ACOCX1_02045 [Fimbriimonadaceae bacterium]
MPPWARLLIFGILVLIVFVVVDATTDNTRHMLISVGMGVAIAFAAAFYLLSGRGFR